MTHKHIVDEVADFVVGATTADISAGAMRTLKRNVLDSIACAVGALDGELIEPIRAHAEQFSGRPTATFIGGGRASVDQAAFFNAVLVRYPDLLDTFLTPGGLCHPADNFGAILAVAEHVGASGSDFLLALAVAYEIQCRFSAQVPVMARGLNHALQLAMSAAAGSAKLLDFDRRANRITPSPRRQSDNVSLAAVHAEPVSNWKGISPAITGMRAVYTTMLAGRGITGPRALFDGPNGLEQLFDQSIDMRTGDRSLTAVEQTYLKQYCSLIHGQAIIDATLALRDDHHISGSDVASVTLEVFQGAYDFAGGGSYGEQGPPVDQGAGRLQPEVPQRGRAARRSGRPRTGGDRTRRSRRRPGPAVARRRQAGARPDRRLSRTHVGSRARRDCTTGGHCPANSPTSKARRRGRCRGIA